MGVLVLLLVGIAGLSYSLLRSIPFRVDMSRQQALSLTEQSIQLLKGLSIPVSVTAFVRAGDGDAASVLELLREYQRQSSLFELTVVDPDRDPERALVMGVDAYGTIVFETKYGRQDIYIYQLFAQDPQRQMPVFVGEQMMTGILKSLVSFEAPRMDVALFGVDRQIQESGFAAFFEIMTHDFRQLRLVSLDATVSDPADLLLVVLPSFPLSETVILRLKAHLEAGRHMILLMDPLRPALAVSDWLSAYGIQVLEGVIMDPPAAYFNSVSTVIPTLVNHEMTKPLLDHQLSMVLPVSGGFSVSSVDADIRVSPLLMSSEKSWRSQGQDPSIEPGQIRGPFVLGALFENGKNGSKLLLIRDADFLRDEFMAVHGNQDFILNAVSVLLGKYDDVTIRPRLMGGTPIVLTLAQTSWIFVISSLIMPFLFVMMGVVVWWRRRRQRR
jgi:hypothetical protein